MYLAAGLHVEAWHDVRNAHWALAIQWVLIMATLYAQMLGELLQRDSLLLA